MRIILSHLLRAVIFFSFNEIASADNNTHWGLPQVPPLSEWTDHELEIKNWEFNIRFGKLHKVDPITAQLYGIPPHYIYMQDDHKTKTEKYLHIKIDAEIQRRNDLKHSHSIFQNE